MSAIKGTQGHCQCTTYFCTLEVLADRKEVCAVVVVCSFQLQLIFDVKDGGGSIGLLSTAPQGSSHLKRLGVYIPTLL